MIARAVAMPTLLDAPSFLRALRAWSHDAPRTWSEIVGAYSGAGSRLDGDIYTEGELGEMVCLLTPEQDAAVGHYTRLLGQLVTSGSVRRELASDPRFDLFTTVAGPDGVEKS